LGRELAGVRKEARRKTRNRQWENMAAVGGEDFRERSIATSLRTQKSKQ